MIMKIIKKIFNSFLVRILPRGAYLNYQCFMYNIFPIPE